MNWNRRLGRRSLLKVAGAGTAAYLLGGCAPTPPLAGPQSGSAPASQATPAAGAAPPAGGSTAGTRPTIRLFALQGQGLFEAPNPFGSRTGPGMQQASYIFDSLAWRDSTVDPIPWLAEKWTSSPDGLEWTFNLRQGVKFHDGQPLTAEDVAFTYGYLVSNQSNYTNTLKEVVKAAKALDEQTVRITLNNVYAPFLNSVAAYIPVIPKHIWSDVADPKKFNDPKAYMGSGPYTLGGMNESDGSLLFVANDNFFLGKPYVKRLEFIKVGDELVALKAGQLDVAIPLPTSPVPPEALAPFKDDPKFGILEGPGEAATALHFNLTKGAPYNDVSFRQAVFHAIDRQELVNRVLGGNGEPGSPGFLPSANPYSTTDVEQYPYSPSKAGELLDKAGYLLKDGQRTMPGGSALAIPLLFGSPWSRVAELVRTQLSQVGIKLDLRPTDPGTASQMENAGNYEMAIATYGGLGGDPDFMRRVFSSPEQVQLWYKTWGYKNPEFTQLAQQQLRTTDPARRKELVQQMQKIVSKDVPMMPLYYAKRYVIYAKPVFDAWYFTPLSNPLALNKHFFVTGQKTGLTIKQP